jgi:hypothetical protein
MRRFDSLANRRSEAAKRKAHERRSREKQDDARKWWKHPFKWDWTALSTCVISIFTVVLAVIATLQWITLNRQLTTMQGQLDEMQAEKRPWIDSKISLVDPILFTEWADHKGINLRLNFELKNYGDVPAINTKIWTVVTPHPGNSERDKMDTMQKDACDAVRKQADENPVSGVAVFPNQSKLVESGSGIHGVYDTVNEIYFSVYGCIVYTYGNHRHGETGFRMTLGRVEGKRVVGIPFVRGEVAEGDYTPSQELLSSGYPAKAPIYGYMKSAEVLFREDEGGNYAK